MKEKYCYKVECEWDIGQDYRAFTSKKKAMSWLEENPVLNEMHQDEPEYTLESLFNKGLVVITKMWLV